MYRWFRIYYLKNNYLQSNHFLHNLVNFQNTYSYDTDNLNLTSGYGGNLTSGFAGNLTSSPYGASHDGFSAYSTYPGLPNATRVIDWPAQSDVYGTIGNRPQPLTVLVPKTVMESQEQTVHVPRTVMDVATKTISVPRTVMDRKTRMIQEPQIHRPTHPTTTWTHVAGVKSIIRQPH